MLPLLSTEIETPTSFLKLYSFPDEELLNNCIKEVKNNKLSTHRFRKVGFFSDVFTGDYVYGKSKVTKTERLSPSLKTILDFMNEQFETDFNGVLVNEYDNGSQFIEKHRDSKNHPSIGVLIISYGATRTFRVFDKHNKITEIPLMHGQVLHMSGDFQKEFEHDLKKEPGVENKRYSLSFHKYMNLGLYKKR